MKNLSILQGERNFQYLLNKKKCYTLWKLRAITLPPGQQSG